MTITARFASRCTACGGQIQPGETIEWSRTAGSRHTECPARETVAAPIIPSDAIRVSSGSGYRGQPYHVGSVIVNPYTTYAPSHPSYRAEPAYLVVLTVSQQYYREDGMSFGVGDDRGYVYSATTRAATDAESQAILDATAARARRTAAVEMLRAVSREIDTTGERPTAVDLTGEEIVIDDRSAIYGAGSWLVIGAEWVWSIRGNGGDGDNWAHNNMPGRIATRVPATPELTARVRVAVQER